MKTNQRTRGLSDEEIVELFWQRNERAIEETDRKYRGFLYTVAHNIVSDEHECEECLDDTYFESWKQIPPKHPSVLRLFLAKITRNNAMDRYRKNHAQKRIPSELLLSIEELCEDIPSPQNPEDALLEQEFARILNGFLRTLTERNLTVFVCRYYYGDPIAVIAEGLGVSESTVMRDLRLLRYDLRAKFEQEGYTV